MEGGREEGTREKEKSNERKKKIKESEKSL